MMQRWCYLILQLGTIVAMQRQVIRKYVKATRWYCDQASPFPFAPKYAVSDLWLRGVCAIHQQSADE